MNAPPPDDGRLAFQSRHAHAAPETSLFTSPPTHVHSEQDRAVAPYHQPSLVHAPLLLSQSQTWPQASVQSSQVPQPKQHEHEDVARMHAQPHTPLPVDPLAAPFTSAPLAPHLSQPATSSRLHNGPPQSTLDPTSQPLPAATQGRGASRRGRGRGGAAKGIGPRSMPPAAETGRWKFAARDAPEIRLLVQKYNPYLLAGAERGDAWRRILKELNDGGSCIGAQWGQIRDKMDDIMEYHEDNDIKPKSDVSRAFKASPRHHADNSSLWDAVIGLVAHAEATAEEHVVETWKGHFEDRSLSEDARLKAMTRQKDHPSARQTHRAAINKGQGLAASSIPDTDAAMRYTDPLCYSDPLASASTLADPLHARRPSSTLSNSKDDAIEDGPFATRRPRTLPSVPIPLAEEEMRELELDPDADQYPPNMLERSTCPPSTPSPQDDHDHDSGDNMIDVTVSTPTRCGQKATSVQLSLSPTSQDKRPQTVIVRQTRGAGGKWVTQDGTRKRKAPSDFTGAGSSKVQHMQGSGDGDAAAAAVQRSDTNRKLRGKKKTVEDSIAVIANGVIEEQENPAARIQQSADIIRAAVQPMLDPVLERIDAALDFMRSKFD